MPTTLIIRKSILGTQITSEFVHGTNSKSNEIKMRVIEETRPYFTNLVFLIQNPPNTNKTDRMTIKEFIMSSK